MARWKVTISGKGIRKASVEKLAAQLKEQNKGEDVRVTVSDDTPPESRADRLAAALSLISDAKSEVESLRDELQEWYDNLPEGFQNGDKGDQLQEAIATLENLNDQLEEAEGTDVGFPGMY